MLRLLSFVMANFAIKATPPLLSTVVISLSGPAYYAQIAYYFVISSFVSSLFTTGIVPGYTRSIGEKTKGGLSETSASPSDYVVFVVCAVPISICLILAFDSLGVLGQFHAGVAAFFSVSTGLIAILVPILLVMNRSRATIVAVYVFLLGSVAIAITSKWLSVMSYQYVFVVPSILLTLILAYLFSMQEADTGRRVIAAFHLKRITLVIRDIAPVFFPNVFWMTMLFWFANRVSHTQSDPAVFSWYVTGLQIFSVLSFIPNSIAPLILLRLTSRNAKTGYNQTIKTSFVILAAALCVFAILLGVIYFILPHKVTDVQQQVWLPMIAAGCFASTFAPLNAYLVKQRHAFLIFPGAIVWAIVAHVWMSYDPGAFPLAFFTAYLAAWCLIQVCVWLARNEPLRKRTLV